MQEAHEIYNLTNKDPNKYYDAFKSDIYSLGKIFLEILLINDPNLIHGKNKKKIKVLDIISNN
jgi:hypothetical protein